MYISKRGKLIKNLLSMGFILFVAVIATHYIYYKFKNERIVNYSSESLDIVFHEETGDKVTIDKINPVNDSVGLSSKAYILTIKNNLTEDVGYKLKLVDDNSIVVQENCGENQIPSQIIKVSVKKGKEKNIIYTLSDLENGTLDLAELNPLEEVNYTIRVWITSSTDATILQNGHYHGQIQVVENNVDNEVQ